MKPFKYTLVKFVMALGLSMLLVSNANAIPAFARQTGMNCVACHTSFPELTPFGREFKLNGYTLGETQWFPFAAMATASTTSLKNNNDSAGTKVIARQGAVELDAVSIFIAGRVNDNLGGWYQWTYTNHQSAPTDPRHHSGADNTDLRAIYKLSAFDKELLLGMTFNNNPGVQDVWNTGSAWSVPFNGSTALGLPSQTASAMLDTSQPLHQTVAGLGGYFWWDRHLYGELTMYGDANRALGFMSAGTTGISNGQLVGHNNPYWRLAWNEEWGANSLMIGTYGMKADTAADPFWWSGGSQTVIHRYTDIAVDSQYQYISDPSIFTAQASFLHENRNFNGDASNEHLDTFRTKVSYLYNRTYGASLGFFNTTGTADQLYSTTSSPSSPNARYWMAELDYNYNPQVRFIAQYTIYSKLDQAALDPNATGTPNKPSDFNTLWLATWFAF